MTTETPLLPSAQFLTGTSPVQATGRVSNQPVMRVTRTSSAQTAGCGHTEIKQVLPVKQDYRLQRIAFTHTGQVLIHGLPFRSGPAVPSTAMCSDVQQTNSHWLQPFVGYRKR